jgi:hypothetical protein
LLNTILVMAFEEVLWPLEEGGEGEPTPTLEPSPSWAEASSYDHIRPQEMLDFD